MRQMRAEVSPGTTGVRAWGGTRGWVACLKRTGGAARGGLGEGGAVGVFQEGVGAGGVVLEVAQVDDAGVVESGEQVGLPAEQLAVGRPAVRGGGVGHLEGDGDAEGPVGGADDD